MCREELLVDQDRMYALTRDSDGNLYLEVVCGGFAMENVVIPLTQDETREFERQGKSFLDALSLRICKDPSSYVARRIL
jgi:hypothetical protein